jgi:hypothetical protein
MLLLLLLLLLLQITITLSNQIIRVWSLRRDAVSPQEVSHAKEGLDKLLADANEKASHSACILVCKCVSA